MTVVLNSEGIVHPFVITLTPRLTIREDSGGMRAMALPTVRKLTLELTEPLGV